MSESTSNKSMPTGLLHGIIAITGAVVGAIFATVFIGSGGSSAIDGKTVVATFNGQKVRASDAFSSIRTRLFDLEEESYRLKEQAINEFVESQLIDAEAKKQNMAREALLEKETGDLGEVSDDEIITFLKSKNLTLDHPEIKKENVRDYLKYRRMMEKRAAYVAKLRDQANVKMLVAEPLSPKLTVKTEGYPSWGNPGAKVTVVEFSDFQCPFCSRAVPIINEIKSTYGPDKVRIVFRDMPLPSHDRAMPAALASHCANEQGKFWEYHDKLFANQTKLGDSDLTAYAKELGLNTEKFSDCYKNKRHEDTVLNSKREAESISIQATPSFLINGTLVQGAQPFERFKEKIDRELK